ncbi:MAG: putative phosphotransacetylase [Frankiales bacterium]|nr:putative phosphotransacetylase [Frankiales bacterium]
MMSPGWRCDLHGVVTPYERHPHPTAEGVRQLAAGLGGPLWSPLPLPGGWTLGGIGAAVDDKAGVTRATLTAFAGPGPLGGPADLVLVAEEPGVGLGAHAAGRPDLDPGDLTGGPPDAKIEAAGHLTPLWRCASADNRAAFVGEALGVWLWAVLWPPSAELVLLEHVELHDLRHDAHAGLDLPIGASSPRLP